MIQTDLRIHFHEIGKFCHNGFSVRYVMSLVNHRLESEVRSNSHKTDNKCYIIVRVAPAKKKQIIALG
jgi:hypothetical protein